MRINTVSGKISAIAILLATLLVGYGIGLLPKTLTASPAYGQTMPQYSKCYALRTASLGYDEFNQGIVDEEEAILIPSGWTPVGFASGSQGSKGTYTLVCGNGDIPTQETTE